MCDGTDATKQRPSHRTFCINSALTSVPRACYHRLMSAQPPVPPERPPETPKSDAVPVDITGSPDILARLRRWLPRVRQPIQRDSEGGITIAGDANVEVRGDLVAGDKIVNIGSLVVPVRFFVALLAVAAVLAVVVWWFAIDGKMPAGASVAVVDFADKNASGALSTSADGKRYAEYMSEQMANEANGFPLKPAPVVWHIATGFDPVAAFWKRLSFSPVGNDAQAETLANNILAQVVVYGFVETGADGINVTPRFFVRQAKGEADELSDPQQLGQAITISKVNEGGLDTYLFPLSQAMLYLTKGLWAELDGDFVQAYSIFRQAEEKLRGETAFPRELGKEVLYYFLGESAMLLSQCETDARQAFPDTNSSASLQALDAAEAAFNQSIAISEGQGRVYARPTFGLAQVAFGRALRILYPPDQNTAGQCKIPTGPPNPSEPTVPQYICPLPPPQSSTEQLDEARALVEKSLGLYDKFFSMSSADRLPRLDDRARAARANVESTLAAFDLQAGKPADAETRLRAQIPLLESVVSQMDPQDKITTSETYYAIGNAYNYLANARAMQGDNQAVKPNLLKARDAFNACIGVIGDPKFQSDRFQKINILPSCFCAREGVLKTLEKLP